MATRIDLDRYCERVGYQGSQAPTIETLTALHGAHARAIPFDNLDPLLGVTPKLDVASLEAKLVGQRRGGYCFEHNVLFQRVLESLGFQVMSLSARVLWNIPADVVLPRSHMLLRVDHRDGTYLADTGFGGLTLTAPIRLALDIPQDTPHESFRVTQGESGLYRLEVALDSTWRPLYHFDLQPQHLIDYEVMNWFLSTSPRSHFIHDLVVARADIGRRYTLRNTSFAVHHVGGWTDRQIITTAAELEKVLTGPLGLTLPDHPGLDRVLSRIVASPVHAPTKPLQSAATS